MKLSGFKIAVETHAYNAEKTLRRAVESVLGQTHENLVYYLIDNGSTDGTRQIIAEYAAKDKRVIPYYYMINTVYSFNDMWDRLTVYERDADYWIMLCADDEYEPKCFEKLLHFAEKNKLDIAACRSQYVDAASGENISTYDLKKNMFISGIDFDLRFTEWFRFFTSLWGKLYSARLIRDSNAELRQIFNYVKNQEYFGLYGIDNMYNMALVRKSGKIGVLATILHKYYRSRDSISFVWRDSRIFATELRFDAIKWFLIEKCGGISDKNRDFLTEFYFKAVRDSLQLAMRADNLSVPRKIQALQMILAQKNVHLMTSDAIQNEDMEGLMGEVESWVGAAIKVSGFWESVEHAFSTDTASHPLTGRLNKSSLLSYCDKLLDYLYNFRKLKGKW
jgi:glycosyltransferase involved in cell wall biosynthesis